MTKPEENTMNKNYDEESRQEQELTASVEDQAPETPDDDTPIELPAPQAELDVESATDAAEDSSAEAPEDDQPEEEILPLLPLRGTVVLPLTLVPLAAAQERSLRLIDDVMAGDRTVAMVMQTDAEVEGAGPDDIYQIGTITTIHQMMRVPDGSVRLAVQGLERMEILEVIQEEPYLKARIRRLPEEAEASVEVQALMRNTLDLFQRLVSLVPHLPDELVTAALNVDDDARHLVYLVASNLRMEPEERQNLLELNSVTEKLQSLNAFLTKELDVLELGKKIQTDVQEEMGKSQREYFLREQMKAIQKELGEGDETQVEVNELREKIEQAQMPEEAEREAKRELDRLSKLPPAAAEYGVIKTYLDWMTSLPWNVSTEGEIDIQKTREILDADHYGLDKIKDRILEYLAVRKLKQDAAADGETEGDNEFLHREPILCFVGPPGVGKTSLAQSIAHALGREMTRMSLGGVRDESEIRGHRRTYVGAMPGRIIQAIRRAGSNDPVFVLDEVDKLGNDWRGDPSSALLEVLDPEQNNDFRDHYLDVPFDLSKVMFIATANMLDTIPAPLRDRMEIVELSSYTDEDKLQIAKRYLVPKQMKANGLAQQVEIDWRDDALMEIIQHYTRESGVRNLEREIGASARKIATKVASGKDAPSEVTKADIREYLGRPRYFYEEREQRTRQPGVAIGVGVNSFGGDIMFIEATRMPGKGSLTVTGQLGDVMRESAQAAFSFVRSRAKELGIDENFYKDSDIHIHVPAGAIPKDGPSAGVALTTALVSLLSGVSVRDDVAMTGEFTLRGQVLPVGGIKEKALGARRAGITTFILPRRNEVDLDDLPQELKDEMTFVLADTLDDALAVSMPQEFHDVRAASAPVAIAS
ncbi:MAG TPA: endopeptidase La [Thermomicrobiales bacterium]|nr:endopeptidase La [Thermomicrobiales bacterium]